MALCGDRQPIPVALGGVCVLPGWYVAGVEFAGRGWVSGRPGSVRLVEAHSRLNAVLAELFELIAELDTAEARLGNSVSDMVSWLGFDLGVGARTARGWVRVAHALVGLPLIREAFTAGVVSFDEVEILCRYATSENEVELLVLTRDTPTGELAAVIRGHLQIESVPRWRPEKLPWLEMFWNDEHNHLNLRGEIGGVDGLMVETALRRVAAQAPLDPGWGS